MAKRVTEEILKERFKKLKHVKYLEGYTKMHGKIKVKCLVCKHIWLVIAKDILADKSGCPECANKKRLVGMNKKKENYLEELVKNSGEDYTWLEKYNHDNKEKLLIRHNECGNEYYVRPNDFQQGYRCPKCSRIKSLMERKLINFLDNNKIPYINEKTETINNTNYNFDFYLPLIDLYIEIDGEQHFRKNSKWFKEGNTRKRDLIKNQFIIDSGKRLLRIPYHSKKDVNFIIKNLSELINEIKEDIVIDNNYMIIENGTEINKENYYRINESLYCT